MAAVLLFWDTNMAAVTSYENTLQVFGWNAIKTAIGQSFPFSEMFSDNPDED